MVVILMTVIRGKPCLPVYLKLLNQSKDSLAKMRFILFGCQKKKPHSRFITFAIVRRLFEKHQVCLVGLLVVSTHCSQLLDAPSLFVHHLDMRGAFISCAQDIPYLAEWRQFPPTHSDAARTRHSMALAHALHSRPDGLQKKKLYDNVMKHCIADVLYNAWTDIGLACIAQCTQF